MLATLRRLLVATLVGTLALFVWGMIFWGALVPGMDMFHAVPNEARITAAFTASGMPTGTYFTPWPRDTQESAKAFRERHLAGGFWKLSWIREGVDPASPRKLLHGALHHAAVAFLAALLIAVANGKSFPARFLTVLLAGAMGTVFITLADPIWFHLPWDYAKGALLYETIAWMLLGFTTAWLGPK